MTTTTGIHIVANDDATLTAYRDSNRVCDAVEGMAQVASYLFPPYAWPGGYPVAYYPENEDGDIVGDVVCADCRQQEWVEDQTTTAHAEIEEEAYERALTCDGCACEIVPQQCRLCHDPIDELPYDQTDRELPRFASDYYVAHGHCVARSVQDHRDAKPYRDPAHKTGKGTYRVGPDTYRSPNAAAAWDATVRAGGWLGPDSLATPLIAR